MKGLILKPGDFFSSDSVSEFGSLTVKVEKLWAKDGEAKYSHSGIIVNADGGTVESKSTVREGNISDYIGHNLIIGRWRKMSPDAFNAGLSAIKYNMGTLYPFWRLPMFMIPFLAKIATTWNLGVCSELVAKFLLGAGMTEIGKWQGQNPDDIAEIIEHYRSVDIIFQGKITE